MQILKLSLILFTIVMLSACAKGSIDILDRNNQVIGQCSANFNWHWYGAQDSVDYLLYICAKGHVEQGRKLSDSSILKHDYTVPSPPNEKLWNQKSAYKEFKVGKLSEKVYGYILAKIEYRYIKQVEAAKIKLKQKIINQSQYEQLLKQAKSEFTGN